MTAMTGTATTGPFRVVQRDRDGNETDARPATYPTAEAARRVAVRLNIKRRTRPEPGQWWAVADAAGFLCQRCLARPCGCPR